MGKSQKKWVTAGVMMAVLTLFAAGRALAATLVVDQDDNPCTEGNSYYGSISEAVYNANDGDTIEVCDGTYTESFVIYQPDLTLESVNPLGATIQAPECLTPGGAIIEVVNDDSLLPVKTDSTKVNATASDGGGVVIDGFNIMGPAAVPGACNLVAGVFVHENATATVSNNDITSIRDNPISSCQQGYGIRVGSEVVDDESNDPGTGTLSGNTITDYQKGGIFVDGDGSSATITGNVVTGAGKTKDIGQNGIQVSNTTLESTITGNMISDNFYSQRCVKGNCWRAVGVLELNAGARGDKVKILKNNQFSNNQTAVVVQPMKTGK